MRSRRSLLAQLLAAGSVTAGLLPAVRCAAQPGAPVAPEFNGIDAWLNAEASVSLAGLRGKVVLVDFWTYSCINCRRTVPYLNRDGRAVLVREGEGHARELEAAIRALLSLAASGIVAVPGDDPDLSQIRPPEIYFGALHPTPQDRTQQPRQGEVAAAPQAATLHVTVDGGAAHAIEIGRPTLYTLFDGTTYAEHVLAFEAATPGLSLFSATFG